jgi:hypothetical protein
MKIIIENSECETTHELNKPITIIANGIKYLIEDGNEGLTIWSEKSIVSKQCFNNKLTISPRRSE